MRATMHVRLLAVPVLATIILTAIPVQAQSRGERGSPSPVPARRGAAVARGSQPASPNSATREPGSENPPKSGYIAQPNTAPAGSVNPALIPSDPLDRGYWELYDSDKEVTLTGKVTRVDWANPNSYVYLMADGTEWAVESGFIQFRQSSVTPAIHVDDTITISGYLPKDQPISMLPARISPRVDSYLKKDHLIRAGEITTVFGQKLVMGQPPSQKEMAERLKCSALGC